MKSDGPTLRGAVIGCGFVSQYHLEAWSHVPDARVVALCDTNNERLKRAVTRFPEARLYKDAAALFGQESSLDFVEICTQPDSHRELVEMAARHGVDILCQKPAASERSDYLAMIDACAGAGVRLMIHENWRFRPWYRAMRSEIIAGAIGRPIRLRLAHRDTRALRPDGFAVQPYLAVTPKMILMDMGCHLIDTARYLLGEIQTVSATIGHFGPHGVGEDVVMLALRFVNGTLGWLDLNWCAAPESARLEWALNETVVEGTAGSLRLLTDGSLERMSLNGERERKPVALPANDQVYVEGYLATQRHFIEGLIAGYEHETRASDNLKTMDAIWAAYRSAEEGRTISVSESDGEPLDARTLI
jgi:D-apiose dehydrogenase